MKKNYRLIISISIMSIACFLFIFTFINHINELKEIKECANTPGCMYCLPKWVAGKAIMFYFLSLILMLISFAFYILHRKVKKRN